VSSERVLPFRGLSRAGGVGLKSEREQKEVETLPIRKGTLTQLTVRDPGGGGGGGWVFGGVLGGGGVGVGVCCKKKILNREEGLSRDGKPTKGKFLGSTRWGERRERCRGYHQGAAAPVVNLNWG